MNWDPILDPKLLKSLKGKSAWFIGETRLITALILKEIKVNYSETKFSALTTGDAVFKFLSLISQEKALKVLATDEQNFLLSNLWFEQAKNSGLFQHQVESLKQFVDAMRLYQADQQFLFRILDRYGDIAQNKEYAANLFRVLEQYRLYQTQHNVFDSVGMIETLVEYLSSMSMINIQQISHEHICPEVIIVFQPTKCLPLQQALWKNLSKFSAIYFYQYQELQNFTEDKNKNLPPSMRYLGSLLRFSQQLKTEKKTSIQFFKGLPSTEPRQDLVSKVIDGVTIDQKPDNSIKETIEIWRCRERREEVVQTADFLSDQIKLGKSAEDFQIVSVDLEPYRSLIENEFTKRKISFCLTKGKALKDSAACSALLAFIQWFVDPSFETLKNYYSHTTVEVQISTECINRLFDSYDKLFSKINNVGIIQKYLGQECYVELKSQKHKFDPKLLQQFFEYLDLSHYLNDSNQADRIVSLALEYFAKVFIESDRLPAQLLDQQERLALDRQTKRFIQLLPQLAQLDWDLSMVKQFVGDKTPDILCKNIRKEFFKKRSKLNKLKKNSAGLRSQALLIALDYRAIRGVFTSQIKMFAKHKLLLQNNNLLDLVTSQLKKALTKTQRVPAINLDNVLVTEFLDLRSSAGRQVIILGVTETTFPGLVISAARHGPGWIEQIAQRIGAEKHNNEAEFEAFWLLGFVFKFAQRIVFSVPEQTEKGEEQPAAFLYELLRFYPEIIPQVKQDDKINKLDTELLADPQRQQNRINLLKGRSSSELTCYDGLIGNSLLTQEVSSYSVSSLETLTDCPHRFFFRHILKLKENYENVRNIVEQETGRLVHKILERFFSNSRFFQQKITPANFSEACELMQKIAAETLLLPSFLWPNTPRWRGAYQKVIQGLDQEDDQSKRGYLKAALCYQRDLLETVPQFLEYRFGTEKRPFTLVDQQNYIKINGVIDRIDFTDNNKSIAAIWDYKTGAYAEFKDVEQGRSLQLPLYAAALEQHFPGMPILRGGCFLLSSPNKRDQEINSLTKGVLVEHLAIKRSGGRFVLDSEMIPLRIEKAKQKVFDLDKLIREGKVNQISETEACPYCEFKQICCRNEILLEQKLAQEEFSKVENTFIYYPQEISWGGKDSSLIQLSSEQKLASDITKDIVLVAGAGSGKTSVLRNRIISLLLAGEGLDSILAITFTEKAAAEIRIRVEIAIGEVVRGNSFADLELNQVQRENLIEARCLISNAQISTIHAFALQIIGMDPELAGMERPSRILSTGERNELIDKSINSVLLSSETNLENFVELGFGYSLLRHTLAELLANHHTLSNLATTYSTGDAEEKVLLIVKQGHAELIVELIQQLSPTIEQWILDCGEWLSSSSAREILSIEQIKHFEWIVAKSKKILGLLNIDLAIEETLPILNTELINLCNYLHENNSFQKRKSERTNPRNYWKDLKDLLDDIDISLLEIDYLRERESIQIACQLCNLALACKEKYLVEKRKLNTVDFDDLLVVAQMMLCGQYSSAALKTKQQSLINRLKLTYRHIMVDEFQDTDPLQWEILKVLIQDREPGKLKRSVFIVGDNQQAIYGFRKGDVRSFNKARDDLIQLGACELSLKNNYRSHPEIVDFVNKHFFKLFLDDFDQQGKALISTAVKPQVMLAQRKISESNEQRVYFLNPQERAIRKEIKDDVAEAEYVAKFVAEVLEEVFSANVSQSKWRDLAKYSLGPRIALLSRTTQQLLLLAEGLSVLGVPYTIFHSDGFFDLEEIVVLSNLLQFVSEPSDQIALVGVLRSVIGGLSDRELYQLYLEIESDWQNLLSSSVKEGSDFVNSLRNTLNGFISWAHLFTPSEFLEKVLIGLSLKEVYATEDNLDAYRNMQRFIDLLREAEITGEVELTASGALRWLRYKRIDAGKSPNANKISNPVVLSTIHGSKGLEFPMVILPFLDRKRRGRREELVGEVSGGKYLLGMRIEDPRKGYKRSETLSSILVHKDSRQKERVEEKRVFYVGCTRAQEYLVLVTKQDVLS